jgi:hypothetical protein
VANPTRRAILHNAPLGAAALGVLPAMPIAAAARLLPEAAVPHAPAASTGSMVIHVNDVASGRMTLLVGAREVALRSPQLVACFVEAARSSR